MSRIKSKLEKEEARLREVIVAKGMTKLDKEILIKRRKKVEDRLKYFILGQKEQSGQIEKAKIGEKIYKDNYKLIWKKLEEEEKKRRVCFCGGDKIFRPICSECQNWRFQILSGLLKEWILTNQKKKSMEDFFFSMGKVYDKDLEKVGYSVDNKLFANVGEGVA